MEKNGRLDKKGWLIFPAEFRENLEKEMVITRGPNGCLLLYSQNEWQRLAKKLKELPPEGLPLKRLIFSGVAIVEIERGKIPISISLQEYASLGKGKVIVVKIKSHFQIWNEENFKKRKTKEIKVEVLKREIKTLEKRKDELLDRLGELLKNPKAGPEEIDSLRQELRLLIYKIEKIENELRILDGALQS